MSFRRIYLLHPNYRIHPYFAHWLEVVEQRIGCDPEWADWQLCTRVLNDAGSVRVADVASDIISHLGPCVLCRPFAKKVRDELNNRIGSRTVIKTGNPGSEDAVLVLLRDAREMFESGQPYLPMKLVVALLLVAKLEREHMWGSKKGYMWKDRLHKGRGFKEEFAASLPAVINDLIVHGVLIRKTSNGKPKYALNPQNKPAIHAAIRQRCFQAPLDEILRRDETLLSAQELEVIGALRPTEE